MRERRSGIIGLQPFRNIKRGPDKGHFRSESDHDGLMCWLDWIQGHLVGWMRDPACLVAIPMAAKEITVSPVVLCAASLGGEQRTGHVAIMPGNG